jgi:hypothetical protein
MRGGRSLVILLAVALGLGAYIYFVESERDPLATEEKARLFDVTAGDIVEIELTKAQAPVATLRKAADAWTLASPVAAGADATGADAMANGLAAIEIERVLEENTTNFAPFGLETPNLIVTFKTMTGVSHRLQLGNATPTRSGIYARADDEPRVVIVPAFHEQTFDRTAFDLRDRHVLALESASVDRMTLAPRGAAAVSLERTDGNWRLTSPVTARADSSPVDGLVNRITTALMSSIVTEGAEPSAADLRKYGLDAPRLVVTAGSGSSAASLAIGSERDESSAYARDLSRPIVFTVDAALLLDLQKSADDLRVKDIFDLNAFSAQSLEMTHGSTSVAFEKSPPSPEADAPAPAWSRTKPTAGAVNQTALTDLLNTLSAIRADRFVAQAPGNGEDVIVVARSGPSDATREERVVLRRSGQTVYAIRTGDPGAAEVPAAQFETVLSQLKTLTDAQ